MSRCQPKPSLALRVIAVGCAVVWLASVWACSLEALLGCGSRQQTSAEHSDPGSSHGLATPNFKADKAHDANTPHSGDAEDHHRTADGESDPDSSHKHDGTESSCCSTLKAAVQSAKSIIVPKQILQPLALLCVLLDGRTFALDAGEAASDRPPRRGEWASTLEVCTGPANRSHAPPVLHPI